MNLQTNRYNTMVPTAINATGTAISVPFYIQPTTDQKKALLNGFRVVKQKQLLDMGFDNTRNEGRIAVVDNTAPPQTQAEIDLGMTEENLRLALFSRTGLHERLVLKLQEITGIEVFKREDVETTFKLWLDHLYENQSIKAPTKGVRKETKSRKGKTIPA